MTSTSEVNKITVTGNGVRRTVSFSPIVIYANSELSVVTHVIATGVETVRTLGTGATNYSISIPDNGYPATGSIDFPATGGTLLPSTEKLFITRALPLKQETRLGVGPYDPNVQEEQFDKFMAIFLQHEELLDRAIVMPVGTPPGVLGEMPPPVTGLRYLRLKEDLLGWELVELASTSATVASDATPQGVALETAASGTSDDYSRADHAHLVDAYIKLSADIHNVLNFT